MDMSFGGEKWKRKIRRERETGLHTHDFFGLAHFSLLVLFPPLNYGSWLSLVNIIIGFWFIDDNRRIDEVPNERICGWSFRCIWNRYNSSAVSPSLSSMMAGNWRKPPLPVWRRKISVANFDYFVSTVSLRNNRNGVWILV